MKNQDILYFALPIILWPISFLVFTKNFIYALSISALILAIFSLYKYKNLIKWKNEASLPQLIMIGLLMGIGLYLFFYIGSFIAPLLGIKTAISGTYSMIYGSSSKLVLVILLAFIGICEEIYWRGGVQGYAKKNFAIFARYPWAMSTLYYSIVHVTTLNPALVIAAFFLGLANGVVANKYGIVPTIISHVLWTELMIVFLPLL